MQDVCFIADVAVLPRWLRVSQALDFVAGVHPRFDRSRATDFLRKTDIKMSSRVRELSKGMVTQLHLALILAIDARLLVLDEPTLGLDLLFRRQFYDTLLNDYFDKERTIVLTTHQVEEIENLLTDVIFINRGQVVLDTAVDTMAERYVQLTVTSENAARARQLGPFYEREVFGRVAMFFEGRKPEELAPLGELRTPSVADLFVAKISASFIRRLPQSRCASMRARAAAGSWRRSRRRSAIGLRWPFSVNWPKLTPSDMNRSTCARQRSISSRASVLRAHAAIARWNWTLAVSDCR